MSHCGSNGDRCCLNPPTSIARVRLSPSVLFFESRTCCVDRLCHAVAIDLIRGRRNASKAWRRLFEDRVTTSSAAAASRLCLRRSARALLCSRAVLHMCVGKVWHPNRPIRAFVIRLDAWCIEFHRVCPWRHQLTPERSLVILFTLCQWLPSGIL